MKKIGVFNKKKNSLVLDEFAKIYLETCKNEEVFYDNEELHAQFLYWISKYALKTYNVNYINIDFEESDRLNEAYSDWNNNIFFPTALLKYNNFEDFLFESILSAFHEINHIYIAELEEKFKKGLDGEKNINLTINGAESIIEYFTDEGFSEDKIDLLIELIYLNSNNEAYAIYSSCKLGLKFIKDVKSYFKENNLSYNEEILNKIETKLNNKFKFYIKKIESAKNKRQNLMNQLFLKRTIYELENETIYTVLSNKPIYEGKYEAFLTAIEIGIYDENLVENYKKAILINKMGINKAKLYCDLINISTYNISKNDLITAIKLIENDALSKNANEKTKNYIIKKVLSNVDEKVIDKTINEMKNENLEKVA